MNEGLRRHVVEDLSLKLNLEKCKLEVTVLSDGGGVLVMVQQSLIRKPT